MMLKEASEKWGVTWKISDSGKKEKNMRNKILIVEDEKLIQEELEPCYSMPDLWSHV